MSCYSFEWLSTVRFLGKKLSQGFMRVYEAITRCTCGCDFTWVTVQGLIQKTGLHQRTVERHIKKAIAAGLIVKGSHDELQREGYFLLLHPELVAASVIASGGSEENTSIWPGLILRMEAPARKDETGYPEGGISSSNSANRCRAG